MTNNGILLLSALAAAIPTLLYAALIYAVDRYEKEPWWLLTAAFLWGALPGILLAFFINSLFSIPFYYLAEPNLADALVATLVAPPVEESIKALALIGIFLLWKDEIDSPLDGIIYGAMVGMGFAMVENIFYFINVYQEGGLDAWTINVFMRALIFGLNHALFTAMTGLGIAIGRLSRNPLIKTGAPIAGWTLAVILHFLHNFSVSFGGMLCLVTLVADWGGVLMTLGIILWSLIQEQRWIKTYLAEEVTLGTLTPHQFTQVHSIPLRTQQRLTALFSTGPTAYFRKRRFYHRCSELAYKKHHFELFQDAKNGAWVEKLRHEVAELSPLVG